MLTAIANLFDSIVWRPIVPIGFVFVVIGVVVFLSWRVCFGLRRGVVDVGRVGLVVRFVWS